MRPKRRQLNFVFWLRERGNQVAARRLGISLDRLNEIVPDKTWVWDAIEA